MRERACHLSAAAPAGAIFGILFVLPLIYFFVISFWRVLLFKLKPDFTFVNYVQVFELHLRTLVFTLGLALVVAALTTALGFVYAYLIRFKAGLWGPPLLFVALITLFGGYLMKIYSWMTILGITGVLNTALLALGIIDEPLPWLFYNVGAVVVTLVNFLLPLAILPIYGSMRGITDIEMEAARDLGAGGWRSFSDIVVPRVPHRHHRRIRPLLPARGRRLSDPAAGRRHGQHDRRADRAAIRRSSATGRWARPCRSSPSGRPSPSSCFRSSSWRNGDRDDRFVQHRLAWHRNVVRGVSACRRSPWSCCSPSPVDLNPRSRSKRCRCVGGPPCWPIRTSPRRTGTA